MSEFFAFFLAIIILTFITGWSIFTAYLAAREYKEKENERVEKFFFGSMCLFLSISSLAFGGLLINLIIRFAQEYGY